MGDELENDVGALALRLDQVESQLFDARYNDDVGALALRLDQVESQLFDARYTAAAVERVVERLERTVERLRVAVGGTALRGAL
ncbi:MAG: hypothetical protein ACREXG_02510 [Polaromonas sp.]